MGAIMNYDGSDIRPPNRWSAFFVFLLIAAAVLFVKACASQ